MVVIIVGAAELALMHRHGVVAVVFPLKRFRHTRFRIVRTTGGDVSFATVVILVSHKRMPLRLRIVLRLRRAPILPRIHIRCIYAIWTTIIVRRAVVAIVSISVLLRVHSLSLWARRQSVVVIGRAVWLVVLLGIGSLSLRGTVVGTVHLWLAVGVGGVRMIVLL